MNKRQQGAWDRLWSRVTTQPSIPARLPKIGRHVSPRVVDYEDGRVLVCLRLAGMPFESVGRRVIKNEFDALNRTFTALALDKGTRLSITTTLMRQRVSVEHSYAFRSSFMKSFSRRYLERFSGRQRYYENTFYISLLLKVDDIDEGVSEAEDLAQSLMKSLSAYDPECLQTYGLESASGESMVFSQVYEFLGELINGVWQPMPVSIEPARETIPSSWLHWGYDTLELDAPGRRRFAVAYDLKTFPRCNAGQLDPMLSLNGEFTLTQTFGCTGSYAAQARITKQQNKLVSAGDKALHEISEMAEAQGYISSRELAFGEYHAALIVFDDSEDTARAQGEYIAASSLNQCQMTWVRATRSARFTWFSQIPGAKHKPRPMFKSTRNLAAAFSMHNYSSGKARGNPLGDGSAVMPLQTVGKGLYNFSFHASREEQDNTGEKFPGHTSILGATGTGKTALQTAMLGFLERFDVGIFALDIDHGMEIWIGQLGGRYYALDAGEPTGLAPFELDDTPRNRDFLYDFVGVLGKDYDDNGNPFLSPGDRDRIKAAVDAVYELDPRDRRLSRLLESIPGDDGDGLASRLAQWCYATEGRFAWVFDNEPGSMAPTTGERRIGFDVTAFLKPGYLPTEPLLAYLLHLKDLMQTSGGLLATIVEEFWLPLKYATTRDMILKVLKTGRKAGEFAVLVSQSPEEAISSEIWPAIRDQCATKIYLANPNAEIENYRRCNLTDREWEELQKLSVHSHTFLIKQGNQSVFAVMDLYGFDDELAVLSGSPDNVAIWRPILREQMALAEQELEARGERSPQARAERMQQAVDEADRAFQRARKGKRGDADVKEPSAEPAAANH